MNIISHTVIILQFNKGNRQEIISIVTVGGEDIFVLIPTNRLKNSKHEKVYGIKIEKRHHLRCLFSILNTIC